MTKLRKSKFTYTEGRMYIAPEYSLPYELRQFLRSPDGSELLYVDASQAELTLSAWFYKDAALQKDIYEGVFWSKWLSRYEGLSKDTLKRCIYAMSYSASDVSFPADAPRELFRDFTTTYQTWFEGVRRTAYAAEHNVEVLRPRYRNWVTGKLIDIPADRSGSKLVFSILNFRVSQSLSSAMQVIFSEVCRRLQSQGGVPLNLNFDSLTVSWKGHSEDEFLALVRSVTDELVAENKIPCKLLFKGQSGETWASAQGWKPAE